jgi:hypothetical protein
MNDYKKIEEGDDAWKVIVGIVWDKLCKRSFLDKLFGDSEPYITWDNLFGRVRKIVKELNTGVKDKPIGRLLKGQYWHKVYFFLPRTIKIDDIEYENFRGWVWTRRFYYHKDYPDTKYYHEDSYSLIEPLEGVINK